MIDDLDVSIEIKKTCPKIGRAGQLLRKNMKESFILEKLGVAECKIREDQFEAWNVFENRWSIALNKEIDELLNSEILKMKVLRRFMLDRGENDNLC